MAKKTEIVEKQEAKKDAPENCGVCEDCIAIPSIDEIVCAYHYNRNQGDSLHVLRTSHEVRSPMCPKAASKVSKEKYIREKL